MTSLHSELGSEDLNPGRELAEEEEEEEVGVEVEARVLNKEGRGGQCGSFKRRKDERADEKEWEGEVEEDLREPYCRLTGGRLWDLREKGESEGDAFEVATWAAGSSPARHGKKGRAGGGRVFAGKWSRGVR
jgi:hypothetical protein